jgi:hypothetical protein
MRSLLASFLNRFRSRDDELVRQVALGGGATEQPFGDAPRSDWVPDNLKFSSFHERKDYP